MTIIQVFNRYLQPGGEEKSVERIARHLEAGGNRVERFWRTSVEWRGMEAPPKWKQPFLLGRNEAVLRELAERQRRLQADIWILHNVIPVVSLGVYRLASEMGVPVFQWLHNYRPISPSGTLRAGARELEPGDPAIYRKETMAGSWRGSRWQTAWLAALYARMRRRGDFGSVKAWVAVSDSVRRIFEEARWYTDRLFTVRHAWDSGEPVKDVEEDGAFLFLGRLVEEKGIRFLVDLFGRPEMREVRLRIAGSGDLEAELRTRSTPNVEWLGFLSGDEKRREIRRARAVLFPSTWREPLSTVAYEAYEQERSIFVSSCGGMPEIVTDGETGRVLPPAGPEAWMEAILNSRGAPEMGRTGRRWLLENATPERWNADFEKITAAVLR